VARILTMGVMRDEIAAQLEQWKTEARSGVSKTG
jgi:hypothetical protein